MCSIWFLILTCFMHLGRFLVSDTQKPILPPFLPFAGTLRRPLMIRWVTEKHRNGLHSLMLIVVYRKEGFFTQYEWCLNQEEESEHRYRHTQEKSMWTWMWRWHPSTERSLGQPDLPASEGTIHANSCWVWLTFRTVRQYILWFKPLSLRHFCYSTT